MFVSIKYFNKQFDYKKNNELFDIVEYNKNIYNVRYDHLIYMRFKKIFKFSNIINNSITQFIDIIDWCIDNSLTTENILTDILVDELTENINRQILHDIKKLSKK